jgi:hypothetical protein
MSASNSDKSMSKPNEHEQAKLPDLMYQKTVWLKYMVE